jgi:hypothetical protein
MKSRSTLKSVKNFGAKEHLREKAIIYNISLLAPGIVLSRAATPQE